MTAIPPLNALKDRQGGQGETPALLPLVSNFSSPFRFRHLLSRFHPSPETLLLVLSVLIGGMTGIGVVTFHYLIHFIRTLTMADLMGVIGNWGPWTLACIPALGGLIIALMRWYYRDFGPNMSSLIAASQGLQELSPLKPITKMVAASISLGTGASLGPEAPSVEIGANFGMLLAQILQFPLERQRLLLGAGAAAGLAAGFNAPIAGVFFALEVVLGSTFATSSVSVVLLAAVISALIAQIFLGAQPAFALPIYDVRTSWELPLYMGLGLLASGVSLAYTEAIQFAESCFKGHVRGFTWLTRIPRYIHPIIGGAIVGLVALPLPQVMGVGYETVEAMLQDVKFSLPLLILLLGTKLLMTALSLGSGLVGGIFAPAMFLGASLGSAYGLFLEMLPALNGHIAGPPAYAMVGMAAVLAGSARAPLTSILLLFELTRDYRIVLPLMAAVGLSAWLVECVNRRTTHHSLNLHQMGVDVDVETTTDAIASPDEWERVSHEFLYCELPKQESYSESFEKDESTVFVLANSLVSEVECKEKVEEISGV